MKKVLVLIISLLFMPLMAMADMSGPSLAGYDARISNPEGTYVYTSEDKKLFVSYDEVITNIYFEYLDDNGVVWASGYYERNYISVKVEDIKPLKEKVDLKDYEQFEALEMYVYKEGAYLYDGPSITYDQVDGNKMLPVGTRVTIKYYDGYWGYVEFENLKGWVYIFDGQTQESFNRDGEQEYNTFKGATSLARVNTSKYKLLFLETVVLKDNPLDGKPTKVSIPKGTELTYKYVYESFPSSYYVEYNGKSGWVDKTEIAHQENNYPIFTAEEINVYESPNDKEISFKIPNNISLDIKYQHIKYLINEDNNGYGYKYYYYISYKGNNGWIKEDESGLAYQLGDPDKEDYCKITVFKNDKVLKETPDINSKTIYNIKANTRIQIKYKYSSPYDNGEWLYGSIGNYNGWILASWADVSACCYSEDDKKCNIIENNSSVEITDKDDLFTEDESNVEITDKDDLFTEDESNVEITDKDDLFTESNDDKNVQNQTNKEEIESGPIFNIKETAIYWVCVAIVLSLLALVTIKIINKKKEMKNNINLNNNSSNIDDNDNR